MAPQLVLKSLLDAGARLAEPGEFTQRAFLNGKMDLTQAEAVADLIHAQSSKKSDEELMQLLPVDSIFPSMPRASVIDGLVDHTAHHRGALTVYARLLGKTPEMPYG